VQTKQARGLLEGCCMTIMACPQYISNSVSLTVVDELPDSP